MRLQSLSNYLFKGNWVLENLEKAIEQIKSLEMLYDRGIIKKFINFLTIMHNFLFTNHFIFIRYNNVEFYNKIEQIFLDILDQNKALFLEVAKINFYSFNGNDKTENYSKNDEINQQLHFLNYFMLFIESFPKIKSFCSKDFINMFFIIYKFLEDLTDSSSDFLPKNKEFILRILLLAWYKLNFNPIFIPGEIKMNLNFIQIQKNKIIINFLKREKAKLKDDSFNTENNNNNKYLEKFLLFSLSNSVENIFYKFNLIRQEVLINKLIELVENNEFGINIDVFGTRLDNYISLISNNVISQSNLSEDIL